MMISKKKWWKEEIADFELSALSHLELVTTESDGFFFEVFGHLHNGAAFRVTQGSFRPGVLEEANILVDFLESIGIKMELREK